MIQGKTFTWIPWDTEFVLDDHMRLTCVTVMPLQQKIRKELANDTTKKKEQNELIFILNNK